MAVLLALACAGCVVRQCLRPDPKGAAGRAAQAAVEQRGPQGQPVTQPAGAEMAPIGRKRASVDSALAVLKHYWTQTLCLLAEHVRYCRWFDKKVGKQEADTYKRQFMMSPRIQSQVVTIDGMPLTTAHAALQVCTRQENGKIKAGAAPKGALETDAERLLAKLGCWCIIAVGILVLVFSSLGSLQPTEYGLKYNRFSKSVDKSVVYRGGRHFIGPVNTFYAFPATVQNLEFSASGTATAPPLSTRTSAGLSVNVSVAFQYKLDQDGVGALYGRASTNYESLFLVNSRAVLLQAAGNYTNEQYWTARQQIGHDMLALVNDTLRQTWATCTGLQILTIDLPADYEASIVKTQVTNQNILTRQKEQQAALIRAKIDVMVADKERNITVTLATAQANATLTTKSAEARAAQMKIDAEDKALGHVKETLNLSAEALVGYQRGFAYQTIPNATFLFGVQNAVAVVGGGHQGAAGLGL
ncbi:unnamed protein product, partial [Prorocentrum cordatum]